MALKITSVPIGPGGRGFERQLHTATIDGETIGEWQGTDSLSSVGDRPRTLRTFREWKAAVKAESEKQTVRA